MVTIEFRKIHTKLRLFGANKVKYVLYDRIGVVLILCSYLFYDNSKKMTEDWRASLDGKQTVVAIAIDLGIAFDSVHHNLVG